MGMFDSKRFSEDKRKALEVAEEAREGEWKLPSFVEQIFHGKFLWDLIHPYPQQDPADKKVGDVFIEKLEAFLKENLDPDEVDRTGIIPDKVYDGLAELGCFSMKIEKEYGGLGLSQTNYNRAIGLVSSYCGSTAVLLSAHQSIGVPQPLRLFGSKEQKEKYLPRFKKKYISAFALTEPDVGSDPARMSATATPVEDGKFFLLNGLKLWCTNGPIADVMIVMAVTPPKMVHGKEKKQITAFIVEREMPGVEVVHRCRFMGLNGIQNGLLRFSNVRVPRENILWGEGKGLKLALMTLNTGRLTVPAATASMAKLCLRIVRNWSNKRVQWGAPIGKHELVTCKISSMASYTFAMESVTWLVSQMADRGKVDMRLEAAMSKLFCTESAWRIADDTVQIRGGRGYETALSLKGRGEEAIPVERILRDCRINLIIEGTSEIMQLFIAREALDWHLRLAAPLFSEKNIFSKIRAFFAIGLRYASWYPRLWVPNRWDKGSVPRRLKPHAKACEKLGRRLARNMFHAMLFHGPKLEQRQRVLGRIVNIGTDLFAMSSSIARATSLAQDSPEKKNSIELCDLFCRLARRKIMYTFGEIFSNDDTQSYKVGRGVFEGQYKWMEDGIMSSYNGGTS